MSASGAYARSSRASPAVATNSRRQPSRHEPLRDPLDPEPVRVRLHDGRAFGGLGRATELREIARERVEIDDAASRCALAQAARGGRLGLEDA